MSKVYHSLLFFLVLVPGIAQPQFHIEDDRKKFSLPFELVSDLVIIPVEINGVDLSFLLDTGVNSTILFSLDPADSLELNNAEFIYLRGLGAGEPFKALRSSGNHIKIGKAFNRDLLIYVVYDNPIDLSNRIGVPVHGIIGYDFFKDFVIEINYIRKKMQVEIPESFIYKNCRKCEDLNLSFNKNKPYVNVEAEINNEENIPLNLLIDSGSGDALWIFKNETERIKVPEVYFEDFLGYGMGGGIFGLRSRIGKLSIGKFNLRDVTASFPDASFLRNFETFEERSGSIGSQVLKRFHVTFDYPNRRLRLKPNRFLNKAFEYDMSGIVISHDGFTVVKDNINSAGSKRNSEAGPGDGEMVFRSTTITKFKLEPQYKVVEIRPASPAEKAGLQKGDILLTINNRPAYKYSLAKLTDILSSEEGKKIRLKIERDGREQKISFKLKKVL